MNQLLYSVHTIIKHYGTIADMILFAFSWQNSLETFWHWLIIIDHSSFLHLPMIYSIGNDFADASG